MLERFLEALTAPLPKAVRFVVLPVIGFWLVLVFVFLGFPYDVLADRAVTALERRTGAVIRYGEVEPRLTVGGPGFRFRQLDVRMSDGRRYSADPVSLRPAWSTGWLTGSPRMRAFVISDHGSLAGYVTLGDELAWDGRIVDLDLGALPLSGSGTIEVTGRADFEADVRVRGNVAEGEIDFSARQGDVAHPMIPMPVEFDTLDGHVVLGGDDLVKIDSISLVGPIFSGTVSGRIGQSPDPADAPLDLAIGVEVTEPGMRSMARQFGLALDEDGHAAFRLAGTASQPELD